MLSLYIPSLSLPQETICCIVGSHTDAEKMNFFDMLPLGFITFVGYGVISTVYIFPGCTPYNVTLFLLTINGDLSKLTLCVTI